MSNILYFPTTTDLQRTCGDCGCIKAARGHGPWAVDHLLTPTKNCERCGDLVEVPIEARYAVSCPKIAGYCDDCGSEDDLAVATVSLPDGMGHGRIQLCAECVSRYDEGEQDPNARTA